MSLIKQPSLTPFKSDKGFKYGHFWEYYTKHDRLHWTAAEINLAKDIQDYQSASDAERNYINGVLRLFTQNEIEVNLI